MGTHLAHKIEFRDRAILQGMGERDIFRQFPGITRGTLQRWMKPVNWTVSPQEGVGLWRLAIAELDEELEQSAQMRVKYDALTERVQDLLATHLPHIGFPLELQCFPDKVHLGKLIRNIGSVVKNEIIFLPSLDTG
jgi:hypothetical protein